MAVCVSNCCILTAKNRVLVTFSPWSYGIIGLNPAFTPIPGKWVENVERGDLTLILHAVDTSLLRLLHPQPEALRALTSNI